MKNIWKYISLLLFVVLMGVVFINQPSKAEIKEIKVGSATYSIKEGTEGGEEKDKVIVKTEAVTEETKVEAIESEINRKRLIMIDAFKAYNDYVISNNSVYDAAGVGIEAHSIFNLINNGGNADYQNDAVAKIKDINPVKLGSEKE